jgi:hypothetical protein
MIMLNPIIEFKYPELISEFIMQIDSRLRFILFSAAGFAYYNFGKRITLTELMRTQIEQDEIYANNLDYQKTKWQSVHQFGRGADLSIQYYTADELNQIVNYLNSQLQYNDENRFKIALVHDVGYGNHLHIQVSSSDYTKLLNT